VLRLATQDAIAVVFVTHSVEEAVYMASRVVVLSAGPGRIAGVVEVDAPLPRPPGFRAAPAFGAAGEAVSRRLEAAVGAAAG
jgi:NitT/TauT family transport system ATP-binding protein